MSIQTARETILAMQAQQTMRSELILQTMQDMEQEDAAIEAILTDYPALREEFEQSSSDLLA